MKRETIHLSDETLIARVAQQDKTAFENLYDRHAPTILGILLRVIKERAIAENILQETFWHVWQSASAYSSAREPFASWLFRIARNYASHANDPQEMMDSANLMQDLSGSDAHQIPDLLEKLPPEQRQVIEMAYFHGMTPQKIARATGQPLNTVSTLARLGLQNLIAGLKSEDNDV